MKLKDLAASKLKLNGKLLEIIKDDNFLKLISKGNVLEYETDGTVTIGKKQTVSIRERIAQTINRGPVSNPETAEISMDAKTDLFLLDNNKLEVSAAKILNQTVNDQEYEDQVYFLIKLMIGVTRTEGSLLEIFSPDIKKDSELLVKREKATYDENSKLVIKKISPFRYEFSVTIPSSYGAMDLSDMEGLNIIIKYIDSLLAKVMDYNYTSGEIKVSNDTLAKHSLALGNKSRIRNFIADVLRESQGDQVSQIDIDDQSKAIVDEIWETLGVKPLTDKRLDIDLQVLKIHRSSNPEAFSTSRRNVTIMKDDSGSVKIERLRYSIDKSVPYLTSQESAIASYLTALIGFFTIWAENEARVSLGFDKLENNYKLKDLYPNNKKVLTVLGFSDEQAEQLSDQVSNLVTTAMSRRAEGIRMDALSKATN